MRRLFLPIVDYFRTRRKVILKFIAPIVCASIFIGLSFLIPIQENADISQIFSDFISALISIVAIFISFSIAIISILVSADNPNIQRLRDTQSKDGSMKELNGKPLTLFQVLLSNLAYNVFIEVLFLVVLIVYLLVKAVIPTEAIRYLIAFGVFGIVHILQILLETVVQMYHTFWQKQ